jgi:hypothetical protein
MKHRLVDLKPRFLRYAPEDGREIFATVETLAEAQGIMFLCPLCFDRNKGSVGTHGVICWSASRGVPAEASPKPGRWRLDGTGMHDLTLNADPPASSARSVLITGGCGWHGFITDGEAQTI